MTKVIINEQHKLLEDQERILNEKFSTWDLYKVPADGWNVAQIEKVEEELRNEVVIFCSPIPLLIARLSENLGYLRRNFIGNDDKKLPEVLIFHNDHREKKELPNGKVISVVAQTGWELISV